MIALTAIEIATFFGLPILCLLLLCLRIGVSICESFASRSWPTTTGVIEESALQADHDGDQHVLIRYAFFVDQQPYWGNESVSVGRDFGREELGKEYPIGRKLSLKYNPSDPENQSLLTF